jgi:hypothetical protein
MKVKAIVNIVYIVMSFIDSNYDKEYEIGRIGVIRERENLRRRKKES